MSVKSIAIGWDDLGKERNEMFLDRISSILLSIGGLTDKRHIKLYHTKEELDDVAEKSDYIIAYEKINGTPMSQGAIKKWRNSNPDIRVLLLVSDERKGTGKMKGLYDIGYMDALYYSDFEDGAIEDFIEGSRSEKTAYDYYGLDEYQDPLDKEGESVKKSKKTVREEVLREEIREKEKEKEEERETRKERREDGTPSVDAVDEEKGESREPAEPAKKKRERDRKGHKPIVHSEKKEDPVENSPEDYKLFFSKELSSNAISSASYTARPSDDEADENDIPYDTADEVYESEDTEGYGDSEGDDYDEEDSEPSIYDEPSDTNDTSDTSEGEYIEGYYEEGYYDPAYNPSEGDTDSRLDEGYEPYEGSGNENEPSIQDYAPADNTAELRDIDFSDFKPKDGPVNEDGKIVPFVGQKPGKIYDWIKHKTSEAVDGVRVVPYKVKRLDREKEAVLMHYLNEDPTFISNLERHLTSPEKFHLEVAGYIASNFKLSDADAREVYSDFYRFMNGYDVLEPLVLDTSVTDIKCYEPDNVRVKRLGGREEAVDAKFRSAEHYRAFVAHIARMNHASVSGERAIVKFEDVNTYEAARLRVNISTEFINSSGYPFVQIRKESTEKKTTEELISAGMFTPRTAAYLIEAAQNDSGIVFTGKGSAGKTTVMNWLIDYIPKNCSGLCLQEMDELFSLTHPDILFQRMAHIHRTEQESLLNSGAIGEDDGNYDLKNLSINGLLIDIDYFIIGEIKGPEAKYFLNAAYTGNKCWCSVHSPSSRQALHKIADYAKYESDYSREVLLQMLSSLHTVVFLKNFRVAQISEVVGFSEKTQDIVYRDVELDEKKCYIVVP